MFIAGRYLKVKCCTNQKNWKKMEILVQNQSFSERYEEDILCLYLCLTKCFVNDRQNTN